MGKVPLEIWVKAAPVTKFQLPGFYFFSWYHVRVSTTKGLAFAVGSQVLPKNALKRKAGNLSRGWGLPTYCG